MNNRTGDGRLHQNGLNLFSSPGKNSKSGINMADNKISSFAPDKRSATLPNDQATQTNEEDTPPDEVSHIAEILGNDIVKYLAKHQDDYPNKYSKYCKTLRRTADELASRHEILFNGMVNKLKIYENNSYDSFRSIINEIFRDGQINWGRIVTVFTFGGKMAKYYHDHGHELDSERVAEYLGSYVGRKLGKWIQENGGWDGFVNCFPDPDEGENQVWKGLLYTAVGLGALATTLVAVR